eukprot:1159215-Pelagomonas_calceolata.AAC.17
MQARTCVQCACLSALTLHNFSAKGSMANLPGRGPCSSSTICSFCSFALVVKRRPKAYATNRSSLMQANPARPLSGAPPPERADSSWLQPDSRAWAGKRTST